MIRGPDAGFEHGAIFAKCFAFVGWSVSSLTQKLTKNSDENCCLRGEIYV